MAKIALVGGTGDLGKALSLGWCSKNRIVVGSRDAKKATAAVNEVKKRLKELGLRDHARNLSAATNIEAVRNSDVVVLSIPHNVDDRFVIDLSRHIQPKSVVISPVSSFRLRNKCFEPIIMFKDARPISFAEWVSVVIQSDRVVSSLQTFPAKRFYREGAIRCDVPVSGDDPGAVHATMNHLGQIDGVKPLYIGPLATSLQLELMTPLLLNVQRFSKIKSPAVKFV